MARKCINKYIWWATGGFWLHVVQKSQPKTSSWQPNDYVCHESQWLSHNGWLQWTRFLLTIGVHFHSPSCLPILVFLASSYIILQFNVTFEGKLMHITQFYKYIAHTTLHVFNISLENRNSNTRGCSINHAWIVPSMRDNQPSNENMVLWHCKNFRVQAMY